MASDSTGGASTRLERFDGSDPSLYKRWRRRAALMIISLPNTYPAEKYGPKLIEFLAGEAELAVEHIPVEDLAKSGGERLVFKALDERFRPLEKDDMNEALKEFFFETAIRSGEPMKAFITRFVTVERKLREQGVTLPDEVQGWFMLRKLHLDTNQEAMILTATRGSFKIGDVSQAVRAILANTKGTHKTNQKDTFVVTDEQDRDTDVGWDEDQELLQVLAAELQENDNYEEEELLDTFESYKQVRTKMQEVRKARGFRSDASSSGSSQPWRLQGTISARLQQVKARTRCHRCGQVGHWRKECPSRSGGKGSNKGSASSVTSQTSSKEVHIVEADWPTQEDYDLLLDQTASEIELGLDAFMIQGGGESDDSQRSVMLDPWSAPVPLIFREQCSTALGPSTVMNDVQHVHFEVFHEDDDQGVVEYTAAALETHGIPDTACRRSLIGSNVLARVEEHLSRTGRRVQRKEATSHFRFGNNGSLRSDEVAVIPCCIAGQQLLIQVAVLPGSGADTPFLMSKELLKELGARLDLVRDTISFARLGNREVCLGTTSKGHYAVPLYEFDTHTQHAQHSRIFDQDSQRVASRQDCHVVHRQSRQDEPRQPSAARVSPDGAFDADGSTSGSAVRLGGRLSEASSGLRRHSDDGGQIQDQTSSTSKHLPVHLHMSEELHGVGKVSHRGIQLSASEDLQGLCGDERQQEDSATEPGESEEWSRDQLSCLRNRSGVSARRRSQCSLHRSAVCGSTSPPTTESSERERFHVTDVPECSELADGSCSPVQLVFTTRNDTSTKEERGSDEHESTTTHEGRRHGGRESEAPGTPGVLDAVDHGTAEQERRSQRACGKGDHMDAEHVRWATEGGEDPLEVGGEQHHPSSCRGCIDSPTSHMSDSADESNDSQSGVTDITDIEGQSMNRKTRRKLRRVIEALESYDCHEAWQKSCQDAGWEGPDICEVFSVPRVSHEGRDHGLRGGDCFDLQLGDDLLNPEIRNQVYRRIAETKPLICIVCPPCTYFSTIRQPCEDQSKEQDERKKAMTLLLFGIEVCKLQLRQGRYFLFEHPVHARSWKCQALGELSGSEGVVMVVLDMCMFGMKDVDTGTPIKKGTRLIGNMDKDIMDKLGRTCDKNHDHQVCEGQVRHAGKWVNRTRLAQVYPRQFCQVVCECIVQQKQRREQGHSPRSEVLAVEAVGKHEGEHHVRESIRRAHQNLGHPSAERFCLMLKHAGASESALRYAREYKCPICESHQGLKAPKVSKVRRTFEFNSGVCCDTFDLEILGKRFRF